MIIIRASLHISFTIGAVSIIETDCTVDFDEPLGFKGSKYDYSAHKAAPTASILDTASASAGTTSGGVVRELQKAKLEDPKAQGSVFTAFTGSASRIDGKALPAAGGGSSGGASSAPSKDEMLAKRLAAISKSSGGGVASTSGSTAGEAAPAVEQFQSSIGDKYSKKKLAVTAFTGPAHTLK